MRKKAHNKLLPVFYLFHVKSRPAPCRRRFVFVLLLCAAAINGAWDAMLCSKVISAGRTKQEQNKRGAQGAGPLPRYGTRPGLEYESAVSPTGTAASDVAPPPPERQIITCAVRQPLCTSRRWRISSWS